MKKPISRFIILAVVLMLLMGALVFKLGTLTIAEGAELADSAEKRSTREIAVKGVRGRILDRNGIVLAYSKTSYNVEFLRDADNRTDYDSAVYTESLMKAIKIIEAGGGTTIDTSYIRKDDAGNIVFDWGVENESSKRSRYKNFCDAMGFYINDDLTKDSSEWDLSKWPTAEYCYNRLCALWFIPEDMTFDEAMKIISIRQEVNLHNYKAYEPITIAYDVSLDVVAEINMHTDDLPGLQTSQSTTRVYPRGTVAAHIIGYMSRSATEEMVDDLGYAYSDYVGVSGVEATMESYLTGATSEHQGIRTVEVNKNGSIIREISSTPPSDGNTVMLTLDYPLQLVTEQALKNVIDKIAAEEAERIASNDKYLKYYNGDTSKISTAKTGAIVVMDPNTGQVLSMASYPSYDPNWFISGLSDEQSAELFSGEEAAKTTPMRNKAISSRLAPGSIFKMATALAGTVEGVVGLDEEIDDQSPYRMRNADGTVTTEGMPSCWTTHPSNHANQTVISALKNSCNYYFFEVAYRLGIEKLDAWSQKLGLTTSTGIELTGEAVGIVGGQNVLYDNTKDVSTQKTSLPTLIERRIREKLVEYLNLRSMEIDDVAVAKCTERIMQLQDGSLEGKGPLIRQILSEELGFPEGVTSANTGWVNQLTSYLNEIQWKPSLTIRSGIGQGVTLVTPIAVARYASAIANEGTVYDAHVVERILDSDGKLVKLVEPSVHSEIEASDDIWAAIKEGLREVVSPEDGGTAAKAFSKEFLQKYQDQFAGKTGTAQIGTNTKIDIENTSWFVSYTPQKDAELVIVVCVPSGFSGSSSASAVEEILTYYYNLKENAAPENLVDMNSIAP